MSAAVVVPVSHPRSQTWHRLLLEIQGDVLCSKCCPGDHKTLPMLSSTFKRSTSGTRDCSKQKLIFPLNSLEFQGKVSD